MSAPQWQMSALSALTEVPLDDRQRRDLFDLCFHLNDPDEDDEFLNFGLPKDDILAALPATHVTLTPRTDRLWMELPNFSFKESLWFQLGKEDRRALQAVYFHDSLDAIRTGKQKQESAINWLRWLAVREAHREGLSWKKARERASERLEDTPAKGEPKGGIKWSYDLVQRILKASDWPIERQKQVKPGDAPSAESLYFRLIGRLLRPAVGGERGWGSDRTTVPLSFSIRRMK